jgi:large subunit ribosomal protein L15
MVSNLHTIKSPKGSRKKSKRVGRGNSSQKGTTAGRGMKGQRARSGGKSRGAIRAFKSSLQKVPKLRGFKSITPAKEVVTLSTLDRVATEGATVNPAFLKNKGVIRDTKNGVKILATGEISKKVNVVGCLASKKAVEAIEKAGGTLVF